MIWIKQFQVSAGFIYIYISDDNRDSINHRYFEVLSCYIFFVFVNSNRQLVVPTFEVYISLQDLSFIVTI